MLLKGTLVVWHLIQKKIYNDKFEYYVNLINESLLVIVSILFIVFYFMKDQITASTEYTIFGNLMISLFLIIMLFNIVVGLIEFIKAII